MLEALNTALSWVGDLLSAGFMTLANFILGFFPDADASVNAFIDSWNVAGEAGTMNVLYFIDMGEVMAFAGLAVTIVFVVLVVAFVRWALSAIHDLIDSVPVIG